MAPVVTKPTGKQKPPTPPKPVHVQPVNAYKRLIDSKYPSALLEIVDHRDYNSTLHRGLNDSANDDTAPLIDEDADGHAVPNASVSSGSPASPAVTPVKPVIKPPLLPKPLHIPSTKCASLLNDADRLYVKKSPASQKASEETKAENPSSNPFKTDASNPFAGDGGSKVKNNLNPFTSDIIEAELGDKNGLNLIEYLTSTTISETRRESKVKASTLSRVDNLKQQLHNEIANKIETSTSTSKISIESTRLSRTYHSIGYFQSLDEIHKQFESDKESLIERDYSSCRSNVIKRKFEVKSELSPSPSSASENERSNRSSWRSSSEVEYDNRSRSSSIAENEFWLRNSHNGLASPSIKPKHNGTDVDDDKEHQNFDDDDSSLNSSNESYSVRRRLKTWFGSFGKAGKALKRRDSVFYIEPDSEGKNNSANMWETASISSGEDKNTNNETPDPNDTVNGTQLVPETEENETEKEARKEKKAYYVIKELISSEKVFIDVLSLLTEEFVSFVKNVDKENPVVPDSELNKIINYLPQLKCINEDLLKDFEARMENWTLYPKVSDIIIKKGPFLKLFSTYIQNFEKQCTLLDDACHKYHRFAKALKDFESLERCKKLTLKHYMLKPVQRLPQYRLLLEDYLSHLNPNSIDYTDTEQALQIVCGVAEHANKSMEQDMHLKKLLEIQNRLGNHEIIKPGRIFVKEGELYKFSRKELQSRYFILLNDCLLYTSYGSVFSLTVKYKLPLAGMKVSIPSVEDYHNEFSIISTARSFTLRAKSSQEREEWVSALEKTIQEYNKKQLSFSPKYDPTDIIGKKAPVWIPDHRVTMCQICTAEFKVTFRRHHCRACGRVVCGVCSDNKAPLQYMNFQAARVCDDCYHYLLKEFEERGPSIIEIIKDQSELSDNDAVAAYQQAKTTFKKHDPHNAKKSRKYVPPRLEVTANDSGSQMSGWLHRKVKSRSWKRNWFVLKEQVLYIYKASEDVVALDSKPVLGYVIETFKEASTSYEDIDSKLVFQLSHAGQPPLVFYADTENLADRWVSALRKATSLNS